MKGAIIYKSKYGSTKQFALWVNEATKFDLFAVNNKRDIIKLDDYNIIVIGTSIHGGRITLAEFINKNWEKLRKKKVIIMLTSATNNQEFIKRTMERSLPGEIIEAIKVFPVGGRYLFKYMTVLDRVLIKIFAFFVKDKNIKAGMLTERDNLEKGNLKELLSYIQKLLMEK